MVHVRVATSSDGYLVDLRMRGHVGVTHGARGNNLTCAAVTSLVRSCAEAIAAADSIEAVGGGDTEGEFRLEVLKVPQSKFPWMRGVTDVLLSGLRRLAHDEPAELDVEELTYGT